MRTIDEDELESFVERRLDDVDIVFVTTKTCVKCKSFLEQNDIPDNVVVFMFDNQPKANDIAVKFGISSVPVTIKLADNDFTEDEFEVRTWTNNLHDLKDYLLM